MIFRFRIADEPADVPPPTFPVPAEPIDTEATRKRLLADARAEADQLRQSARESGRLEGEQAARQHTMRGLERIWELVTQLEGERSDVVHAAQGEVVDLVLAVAGALVHGEIGVRPERVLEIILPFLEDLTDRTNLRLRLHPDDVNLLRAHAHETTMPLPQLVADPTLRRGDCRVESDSGTLDARLETRLAAIRAHLEPRA